MRDTNTNPNPTDGGKAMSWHVVRMGDWGRCRVVRYDRLDKVASNEVVILNYEDEGKARSACANLNEIRKARGW